MPGKVMKEVNSKPLLQYLLEKLEHCDSIKEFVVATSVETSDDIIETYCIEHEVPVYRGSLNDVSSRFVSISNNNQWDAFVRVNGDSPLIDPCLIDKGVNLYYDGDFDIVTNVFPKTYPSGQSVEVVNTAKYIQIYPKMTLKDDFEHVTHFFYRKPGDFKIFNFSSETDYSHIHMSVDTPQDMLNFSTIVSAMEKPHWQYRLDELIELYQKIN
ncbi:MAG: hypothetical protein JXQ82_09085 [Methanomicrobiaceae archaeon]|nr:hypothetical protein [Methanomicrobiaceae archaeon]